MRDLIIGGCSGYEYESVKLWINSINKSGFDGDKVLIVFNGKEDFINKVKEQGFNVINYPLDPNAAIHVQRFAAIYDYIYNNPARYVITTDVRDVVFQYNPISWLEENLKEHSLVVGSECLRYEDEPWGNNNLMETYGPFIHERFKKNTIFNVGVLAGKSEFVRDLCLNIAINSINRPIKICDQAVFNVIIDNSIYANQTYFARLQNKWTAHLGTLADPHKMDYFRPRLLEPEPEFDGTFVKSNGTPVCIVHQYDRTVWKQRIEEIYG
jgi:hypothetical protein